MRIVIIGEYSGFSKNLHIGFRKLGHHSFVFSWGDTFKKIIPDDNTYLVNVSNYCLGGKYIKGSHLIRRFFSRIKLDRYVKRKFKSEKADVVLVLNTAFLKESNNIFSPLFSKEMLFYVVSDISKIFLSACGNDYIFNSFLPMCKKTNEYGLYLFFSHPQDRQHEKFVYHQKYIKKIIPVMYDYAAAYRYFQNEYDYKILKTIPLPFDTSSVETQNTVHGKIKIMHGVSRPHDKGSYIILAALERLQKEYPDRVDVKVVWRIPLSDYLTIMNETNIVIDQCYAVGYGMNAIEALAMGKVVLSGNEIENQKEFGVNDNPIVTIGPSANQIFLELERLVLNPELISEISRRSRRYAENIHDCVVIAKQYSYLFQKKYDL